MYNSIYIFFFKEGNTLAIKNHLDKSKEFIEKTKNHSIYMAKKISKQLLIFIGLILLFFVIILLQLIAIPFIKISLFAHIAIDLFIDIIVVIQVIKVGFKHFDGDSIIERSTSIFFGLFCYLWLLSLFAVIFFIYYSLVPENNFLPKEFTVQLENSISNIFSDNSEDVPGFGTIPLLLLRAIYNYVFPNFYKFPTSQGLAVVVQFYIGKFTDIFMLAFIVDKIKKK